MTTVAPEPTRNIEELVEELRAWLEQNWDPELTLGEWWERLGTSGWGAPTLPTNAYGKGLSRPDAIRISQEIGRFGAVGSPGGLGMLLAAPTIATHGTQEQIDLFVRDLVTGKKAWCQLFSEPGAGSDLAGLTTKAVKHGDEWVVNGQKVWTSGGQMADMGMLLARTDWDVPKHQGITWFALDMHQEGVEVRPLREMTGAAMFSEVFFTDARTGDDTVIGGLNNGWAVANTTLAHERAGLGAGGGGGAGGGAPGQRANQLGRRVGDLAAPRQEGQAPRRRGRGGGGGGGLGGSAGMLIGLAKGNGKAADPVIRQQLVKLHMIGEIARFNNERNKAARQAGKDVPGAGNMSKLMMSDQVRLSRDLGLQILGAQGMLHSTNNPKGTQDIIEATGNPFLPAITGQALYAQAPPIYGGTDQIQRNVIGERVLGLPKEPSDDRTKPFSELPKNA